MLIKRARLESGIVDIKLNGAYIEGVGDYSDADGPVIDADGKYVIPGLIDTHIHGFGGQEVAADTVAEISRCLAAQGTTAWLPTTLTASHETLLDITEAPLPTEGAQVLGFHMEGPYISHAKKGAQNAAYIRLPRLEEFRRYRHVKQITVAPEAEGALDFIREAGCCVSIGHTACDKETALKAIDAGADCLTHTFNAMPPLLHREPGPIGAALERRIYAEVICDGRHVDKAAVLALYRIFGSDRLILISDCIAPAGLPDGVYDSGGLEVHMKSGALTLADGTLAGGSVPLLSCVRTAVSFGIDFWEAVRMASQTPAAHLGVNKGRIAPGWDADLVILNEDLTVSDVIIAGKRLVL